MLRFKKSSAKCALCGAPLSWEEALATRFSCLSTCLRVVEPRHLKHHHADFLREAEKKAPIHFYAFLIMSSLACLYLALGSLYMVMTLSVLAGAALVRGTVVRRRLLKAYGARGAY
ncbi:MAG: hypothetical protein QW555_02135 [Nitrososphaerota archaeon]